MINGVVTNLLSVGPIGPLPWHRDGTEMAKAQRLDTRDTSALQDDKPPRNG